MGFGGKRLGTGALGFGVGGLGWDIWDLRVGYLGFGVRGLAFGGRGRFGRACAFVCGCRRTARTEVVVTSPLGV